MRILVVAIASVVLFFPTFWLFNGVVGPDWGAGIAAVAMYVAFPVIALRIWRGNDRGGVPSMGEALASGQLEQAEYEVREAMAVEEAEDEGLHFYLEVGPNQTLFLTGQYLYSVVEGSRFPSTRIRVYWHRASGLSYGVECLGQPLVPTKRMSPFTIEQMEAADMPQDRQILPYSLSSVVVHAA